MVLFITLNPIVSICLQAIIDQQTVIKKKKVERKAAMLKAQLDKQTALAKDQVDNATMNITRAKAKSVKRTKASLKAEQIAVDKEHRKINRVQQKTANKIRDVLGDTNVKLSTAKERERQALHKAGELLS